MSLNTYSNMIPLPAPVTTGTTVQSYQDPNGDVWIAKNGVRGGAWRRAIDVLRARVYRNAAITAGVANTFNWMPYDTVSWDEYGTMTLNIGSPGAFKAPIAGFYRANSNTAASPTGTVRCLTTIFKNGAEVARGDDVTGPSLGYCTVTGDIIPMSAGDTLGSLIWVSASTVCSPVGSPWIFFTVEYHGTPIGS